MMAFPSMHKVNESMKQDPRFESSPDNTCFKANSITMLNMASHNSIQSTRTASLSTYALSTRLVSLARKTVNSRRGTKACKKKQMSITTYLCPSSWPTPSSIKCSMKITKENVKFNGFSMTRKTGKDLSQKWKTASDEAQ